MTLREKIEGLARWEPSDRYGVCMERKQDGRYIELFDGLRIVAEHEQETKGGGEPARTDLPGHHVTAPPVGQAGADMFGNVPQKCTGRADCPSLDNWHEAGCVLAGEPSEKIGELPRWRRELARLRTWARNDHANAMPIEKHRTLAALLDLCNLADAIRSGEGEAVVPEGVANQLKIAPGTYDCLFPGTWLHRRHSYKADAAYLLAAIDAYGDSLIEVPR